jgi:hypothetical protein
MPPRRKAKSRAYVIDAALLDLPEAKALPKPDKKELTATPAASALTCSVPSDSKVFIPAQHFKSLIAEAVPTLLPPLIGLVAHYCDLRLGTPVQPTCLPVQLSPD